MRVAKKIAYVFLIPLITLSIVLFPTFDSKASTLGIVYVTYSRMGANLDGDDDVEIYIAFTPTSSFGSGSTLSIEYPSSGNGHWCRVSGSDLDVEGVSSTPGDSSGNFTVDSSLPGSLSAGCSQGSGSDVDTIEITGIGALTENTTYGLRIGNGSTSKLGTSSSGQQLLTLTLIQGGNIQTKSFGINIVSNDQVVISAEVVDVQTITCSLETNTLDLGNLYRGGSYVTGSHSLSVNTSDGAAGYYWAVYGQGDGSSNAGLYKSDSPTYLIASDASELTVDISSPGSEGFGINVDVPEGAIGGMGYYDNSTGVFGSIGRGIDNSRLLFYRNWGPQETEVSPLVTYGARAGLDAQAGSYSETITFVCGGYFGGAETEPLMMGLSLPGGSSSESGSGGIQEWNEPENAQEENGEFTYSLVGEGGTCLSSDTLVSTPSGEVAIEDISIGDVVYSYNLHTQQIEISEVGNVWSVSIEDAGSMYYNIYYANTYIKATYNHQFYTLDRGYVMASELSVGDILIDIDNNEQAVTEIILEENDRDYVWDLSINGNHNFFANGVLVHNQGVYDHRVRLIKGGSVGTTDRSSANAWQNRTTQSIYGGRTDLWGQSWEASDLNSSDFGIAISSYGSGYSTDHTSEYIKVNDFGLEVPSDAIIEGIEVRVRKRLRVSEGVVYSEIDFVKVQVYYSEPWTLEFENVSSTSRFIQSNTVTTPVQGEVLVTASNVTDGMYVCFLNFHKNDQSVGDNIVSFGSNDTLFITFEIYADFQCTIIIDFRTTGTITVVDTSNSRTVSEFNFEAYKPPDVSPSY